MKWRRFFNFLAAKQGKSDMSVLEQKLELEQLKVCQAFSLIQVHTCFVKKNGLFESFLFDLKIFTCSTAFTIFEFLSLQENLAQLGVGAKDDIENWFTGEKLGLSG